MDLAIAPGCYRINFLKIISIIVPVVLALIILFGTLGNGLVLFVVTFKQQMRNTTNILILVSLKRLSNISKYLSQKIDSRFCVIFITRNPFITHCRFYRLFHVTIILYQNLQQLNSYHNNSFSLKKKLFINLSFQIYQSCSL